MNLMWGVLVMTKKRDILVEGLKRNVMKVTFTKINGDERIMNCTLNEAVLPEKPIEGYPSGIKKKENKDVLSTWDIDKDGWRSFRLDNVKEYKVLEGLIEG